MTADRYPTLAATGSEFDDVMFRARRTAAHSMPMRVVSDAGNHMAIRAGKRKNIHRRNMTLKDQQKVRCDATGPPTKGLPFKLTS
jgi:hypothetical protein